ncbi:AVT3C-like protein, partial [Mya arenaria]
MTVAGASAGPGTASPVKIIANIFISFIGAGVLGLPFAFKEAMLLLIECKYRILEKHKPPTKKITENGSVDSTFDHAPESENLIEGEENTVLDLEMEKSSSSKEPANSEISYGDVGFCCAYIIFITENLSDYLPHVTMPVWLLILLPPLCILNLARHLGGLAVTSLLAQCSNLFAFVVVLWFDFDHLHNIEVHPRKVKISGLPFFLAISIYCYEGAGMILSLESSLAEQVRHKFKKYFVTTMFVVTTMYVSFGSCGYASFGSETNQIITLNLPKGESIDFAMIVKSCLCLALYFTYPVMMFPVMKLLDGYLIWEPENNKCKGNVLRVAMVLLTGFIVLMIPSFSNIMALVGATCCTLLAFTLPGLFHLSIFKGSLSRSQVMFDWFLMGMGVLGAVIGTIDALNRMATSQIHTIVAHDVLANQSLVDTAGLAL